MHRRPAADGAFFLRRAAGPGSAYTAAITLAVSADDVHLNDVVTMATNEGYKPRRVRGLIDDLTTFALDNRRPLAAILSSSEDAMPGGACGAEGTDAEAAAGGGTVDCELQLGGAMRAARTVVGSVPQRGDVRGG